MHILVVGGAGYIGSHMVHTLLKAGHEVCVIDDLSAGNANSVKGAELLVGSLSDVYFLTEAFRTHAFDGVMNFASFIEVSESIRDPAKFYKNNLANAITLFDAMRAASVKHLVFSSTAAVYGNPTSDLISENHEKHPINPYGRGKWMVEQILEDYENAYDFRSVSLRYFNAAGASTAEDLGERHDPETHLIPLVLQTASGRRKVISLFGDDYDTPDGTCIRDYVHVMDICDAHLLALNYLLSGGKSAQFNLGNGNGFSVKEVINTAEKVTGKPINVDIQPRRKGDPSRLVADARKAFSILGWQPARSSLEGIISDAWAWESKHPWL
ncbi:UDP-glucose 4-epimerase GalE [Pseudomonas avellanae]|uniref:UDP-glucose 4-epimerase n=2 Tax=Pseudomonas syringae group TaxID=136849 RepID=A0A261WE43_9PSED|nr:UDP-glucose 4-epimerase GalE [Pseudomonas syringae]ATV16437.1 UDP-glucose 4-epimerase GalE [Pseudomonas syringae pv. actinidiae]OZI84192.1 UDP-glucose 4-epimerase GalE [Pseudomonas avellanae]PIN58959.1 UDP-glucose 4-epimerase GalE [Pseudomonas syringae pv. actinidiae]GAO92170.1 hypothetical protein PSA5_05655 [Pseudomonas syringae pv. actinidiae]